MKMTDYRPNDRFLSHEGILQQPYVAHTAQGPEVVVARVNTGNWNMSLYASDPQAADTVALLKEAGVLTPAGQPAPLRVFAS